MHGDVLLEGRQPQPCQPRRERGRGEGRHLGDGLVRDADREGLRLEPGAPARGTGLGQLVLPQEHADVLLVALLLEARQEWEDAEEAPGGPV